MTNTTTATATTTTKDSKKRGRKPISAGGKESPRKIFVVCAAIVSGSLVFDEIVCEGSDKTTKDVDIYEEAKVLFEEKHGVLPTKMSKPKFPRNAIGSTKKRDSLNLSMEDVVFDSNRKGTAVYKSWNVSVKFVEGNDDAVFIIYKKHTKEDKKTKPQNKFVRISALENLVEAA